MTDIQTKNYIEGDVNGGNVAGRDINQAQGDIVSGNKTTITITDSTVDGSVVTAEQISNSFNETHHHYPPVEPKEEIIPPDLYHLPKPTTALIGRKTELAQLTEAFTNPNKRLAIIVAAGGIGKSALTDEWLQQIAQENYYGKTRVFGWSFYSQGSHNTFTNSQPFFSAVLPFLGINEIPKDEIEKARLLARCLQQQPCLLILDGLEPLQYAQNLAAMNGELQDSALKEFIACFRRTAGKSFVLLSSRQPLVELKKWQAEHFLSLDLKTLPHQDGAQLLQALGVTGKAAERQAISKDLNGHALSLMLFGHLLSEHHQGDCRYANELPPLTSAHGDSDAEKDSRHALRVLDYYDSLQDAASRCFLQLLGLFDRPMNADEKNALLRADFSQLPSKNPIKRLFGIKQSDYLAPLQKLDIKEWQQLEQRLENSGLLLGKKGKTGYLEWDTHPIIRAYFGKKFKKNHPEAFKQAHLVLFDYYQKLPEKEFPDTLEEMLPLYRAVVHGCLAGEYKQAFNEIYYQRIDRKQGYSLYKLGAYSHALTALAAFFLEGWTAPSIQTGLTESTQAFMLSTVSFCLMSLGRLSEAVAPRVEHLKWTEKLKDWENTAIAARNLVDLYQSLGQLTLARTTAKQAIVYAECVKDKDGFSQIASHSYLATVTHKLGQFKPAFESFKHAEGLCDNNHLSSLAGLWYCALLLDAAAADDNNKVVKIRAEKSLDILGSNQSLLDKSLYNLTIARVAVALKDYTEAKNVFSLAIQGIQKANRIDLTPSFYLERADFHLTQNQLAPALADLNSAWEIIERCGMKLYAVDYCLIHGRYCLAKYETETAKDHYEEAKQLIAETGYHLRDAELYLLAAYICTKTKTFNGYDQNYYLNKAKQRIAEIGQWGLMRVIERDFPNDAKQEDMQKDETVTRFADVGRNAPCPCGSGKKFKQCHGKLSHDA